MGYTASHIFHYEDLEVEIIIGKSIKTREEAEEIAKNINVSSVKFYNDKMVIGENEEYIAVNAEENDLYQFRVCRDGNLCFRTDEDYERISWNEAINYIKNNGKTFSLPIILHSSAYYTCEEDKFEFN